MTRFIKPLILLLTILVSGQVSAANINVPGDQPTIQTGIAAAVNGDTVLVADGTYYENIDFLGKTITVTSVNGPGSTTIDGGNLDWVVTFQNNENPNTVLSGFTITNGSGGIWCNGSSPTNKSSPTIKYNVITSNNGVGVYLYFSEALVKQNDITENSWGINVGNSAPEITGNRINDNPGRGITVSSNRALITYNEISGNGTATYGGGIYVSWSPDTEILHNVVTNNTATFEGGGIWVDGHEPITICGNQVSGNSAQKGGGILCRERSTAVISNNLVSHNTASFRGGGIQIADCYDATLQNNTIIHNEAVGDHGGGMFITNSDPMMTDSIIYFNTANYTSDSIRVESQSVDLNYCAVEGGQSTVTAGIAGSINWGAGMIVNDPLIIDGPYSPACLSQTAAGQASDSPCLDTGSGPASTTSYDTSLGLVIMNEMTTRTDQQSDSGTVDMGWHSPGWPTNTVATELTCQPSSGTLPFTAQFTANLQNRYQAQTRRLAVTVDLDLASGGYFANWRAGWTNIERGETFSTSWPQYFPAVATLVGANTFTMTAADVTPAPFNQPPYPPAGDTATSGCTVTAAAP